MILGVVLAPTDAALGQAVVTEPRVPAADPPGTQRRERAQRRDLRAAAVRGRRGGRRRVGDLRRPQRRHAAARGDRLRRRSAASSAGLLIAAIVIQARPAGPDRGRVAAGHPGRRRRARLRHRQSRSTGPGFIAAFVAGMVFRLALGRDPERAQPAQRGGRRRAQRRHVRALRRRPARPRARRAELAARALRGPQPHGRADAPGRDRDAGLARPRARRSASSAGSAPAAWRRSCSR